MTYKQGDPIFFIDRHGHPVKRGIVNAVKTYKVNTKILLNDGSEWDAKSGTPWGSRSKYWGPTIESWSTRLQGEFDMSERLDDLAWCSRNWEFLNCSQREMIGDMAISIRDEWSQKNQVYIKKG